MFLHLPNQIKPPTLWLVENLLYSLVKVTREYDWRVQSDYEQMQRQQKKTTNKKGYKKINKDLKNPKLPRVKARCVQTDETK